MAVKAYVPHYIDGSRVPGASTIPKFIGDNGGLLWWANRLSLDPLMLCRSLLERAQECWLKGIFDHDLDEQISKFLAIPIDSFDHNKVKEQAATAGKMAHEACEEFIHGREYEMEGDDETVQKATKSFEAFKSWVANSKLQITHTELQLGSREHMYGGTMDAVAFDGKRSILDWKTSGSIYPEYMLQLAGYGKLWEENFPDDPITGGFHLLRFDKENGDFHHHWWSELDEAWEAFLLCRRLYDLKKSLKKRAK